VDPKEIAKLISEDEESWEAIEEAMEFIQNDLQDKGFTVSYHDDSNAYIILAHNDYYYGTMNGVWVSPQGSEDYRPKIEIMIHNRDTRKGRYRVKSIKFGIYENDKMKEAMEMVTYYLGRL